MTENKLVLNALTEWKEEIEKPIKDFDFEIEKLTKEIENSEAVYQAKEMVFKSMNYIGYDQIISDIKLSVALTKGNIDVLQKKKSDYIIEYGDILAHINSSIESIKQFNKRFKNISN